MINNKQTFMLIFYQLFPRWRRWRLVFIVLFGVLLLLLESGLWRLVVEVGAVGVSLLSLFCCCWQRRPFFWMSPSASAPRRRCHCCCRCLFYRRRRLVVVVVGFLSSVLLLLGVLLSAASCCCHCRRLVVVGVVGSGGVTEFSKKLSLY